MEIKNAEFRKTMLDTNSFGNILSANKDQDTV